MAIRIPIILLFEETDIEKAKALITLSSDIKFDYKALLEAEPKEVNYSKLYENQDDTIAIQMAAGMIMTLAAVQEEQAENEQIVEKFKGDDHG